VSADPASEPSSSPPRALRWAGWAISALSLGGVIAWALNQDAPTLPAGAAQLGALLAAVGVYALATGARGERWHGLLRLEGGTPSRADSYALTAVGFMGNNVLPARAGDAMRVYLMAPRSRLRMRDVLGTLIAERVLDLITLLGLFVVLAYGVLRGVDTPGDEKLGIVAATAAVVIGVALAALFFARRTERGRRLVELLRPLVASTARLRRRSGIAMVGLTLVVWTAEACCYLLVGESGGISLSLLDSLYVIAVAGVFVLIPSGPGYAGTLDAAVLFALDAVGQGAEASLSFLIMLRFVLLVPITLTGLVLLVSRYGGMGTRRAAAEGAP